MMKDMDAQLRSSMLNFLDDAVPGLDPESAIAKELAAKLIHLAAVWAEYGEHNPAKVKREKEMIRRWVAKHKPALKSSRLAL